MESIATIFLVECYLATLKTRVWPEHYRNRNDAAYDSLISAIRAWWHDYFIHGNIDWRKSLVKRPQGV